MIIRSRVVVPMVGEPIENGANAEPSVEQVRKLANHIRDIIRPPVEAEASASRE